MKPLLYMRKKGLLGTAFGKHANSQRLSKSVGQFYDVNGAGGTTDFVFVMRTTADNETITLPATGTNNFEIDWGDGTIETVTTHSPSHEYATADDYTITISGTCTRWYFNNSAEAGKLIAVNNLGVVGWNNLLHGFYGCDNLEGFTLGTTDTSQVTSMRSMAQDWQLVTPPNLARLNTSSVDDMYAMLRNWSAMISPPVLSGFDTAKVTSMAYMMASWSSMGEVDIAIDAWNIEACTNMTNMLNGSTLTTECYNRVLLSYSQQDVQPNVVAHFGNSKYTPDGVAGAARDILTNAPNNWTITDGGRLDCSGVTVRIGTDNTDYGFKLNVFGQANPPTLDTGEIVNKALTANDNLFTMAFGAAGNEKIDDTTILNIAGFGDVSASWNSTTSQYEGFAAGLYDYFVSIIGEDVCMSTNIAGNLFFHAASYKDNVLYPQIVGAGSPTTIHSEPMYAPDHEGVMREYAVNEPVWQDGRVVTNEVVDSGYIDVDNTLWAAGSGSWAIDNLIEFSTTATSRIFVNETDYGPGEWILSAAFLPEDAGKLIRFRLTVDGGWILSPDIVIPTNGQRVSYTYTATATTAYPALVKGDNSTTYSVTANGFQMENATGRSDTTTPSEYIKTESTPVTKVFATTNGNSVTDNVVTEGVGVLLDPQPMLVSQGEVTNSERYYNPVNSDGSYNWSGTSGDTSYEYGFPDLKGTLTGGKLTDLGTSSLASFLSTYLSDPDNTKSNTYEVWVQANAGDVYGEFYTSLGGESTYWSFDHLGGLVNRTSTGTPIVNNAMAEVVTVGINSFVRILLEFATSVAGTNSVRAGIRPALGTELGVYTANTAGSCNVAYLGAYINTTIEEVKGAYPIFTEGLAVTTSVIPTFAPANHSNSEGAMSLTFEWNGADTDILSLTEGAYLSVEDGDVGNPELVTNGTFDTDTDWGKGGSWTISDGVAYFTGGVNGYLTDANYNNSPATIGATYVVEFDVVENISGLAIGPYFGGVYMPEDTATVGHKKALVTATATTGFRAYAASTRNVKIDNISVKEADKVLSLTDQTNQVSLPMPASPAEVDAAVLYEQGAYDVLNFTGSEYGTLSDPVTFTGDFEIEVVIASNYAWGVVCGNHSSNTGYLSQNGDDSARFNINGRAVDGTTNITNGTHTILATRVGQVISIAIDGIIEDTQSHTGVLGDVSFDSVGQNNSGASIFRGNIYSIKFTDNVTPSNSQTYIFDSGRTDYQPAEEFSLGNELVVDGGLDGSCGVEWICGAGWEISDSHAFNVSASAPVDLAQNISGINVNDYCMISYDYSLSGLIPFRARTGFEGLWHEITPPAIGSENVMTQFLGNNKLYLRKNSDLTIVDSVDNVSVKKLNKACVFTDIDSSNWLQAPGTMQLQLDGTLSPETEYTNSFGTGDLELGVTAKEIKRYTATDIVTQKQILDAT